MWCGSVARLKSSFHLTLISCRDPYFQTEKNGPHIEHTGLWAIFAFGVLSLVVTTALLGFVLWKGYISKQARREKTGAHTFAHFFRTDLGYYLLSLFACNLLHSIGYTMEIKWAITHAILPGAYCDAQGIFLEVSDLGCSLWSFAIALHTFYLLYLKRHPPENLCRNYLIVSWSLLVAIPVACCLGVSFGSNNYSIWVHQDR